MADKGKNPTRGIVPKTFFGMLAVVLALGALALVQEADIERGILEVCATQQDGYVQLVIDQINLKDNRDDEEMISDILQTMDASTTKYWVFSQDQTMLFVKDVTETNKYKGFSAATYWGTEGAQGFLDGLQRGAVIHGLVTVDGVEYLASGSVFEYDGREYRLCLLTNRAALLDNNDYLGARSRLLVIMLVTLGLLLIVPVSIAFATARARRQTAAEHEEVRCSYERLRGVAERMANKELYDTRARVWSDDALAPFLERLLERGDAGGAYLAKVACASPGGRDALVGRASVLLGDDVVRFTLGDDLVLLFVSSDEGAVRRAVAPLLGDGVSLEQVIPVAPPAEGPAPAGAGAPIAPATPENAAIPENPED